MNLRGLVVRPSSVVAMALAAGFCLGTTAARAQGPGTGGDEDLPKIRITPAGGDLFRLALPKATGDGDAARMALDTATRDLDISGIFHLLDPDSFPADLQNEGLGFSSALWSQVGAQGVAKLKATRTG